MTIRWHQPIAALARLGAPHARLSGLSTILVLLHRLAATRLSALIGRTDLPRQTELAALPPTQRVLIAGFASCIALIVFVTAVAVISVEFSRMELPIWSNAPKVAEVGMNHGAPVNFDNILLRPLFSRSRQSVVAIPIQVPPPSTPVALSDREITLKGIFINGSSASAFLLSSDAPLGIWVHTNEQISGWKVVAVSPDQVELEGQGETRTVWLDYGPKK